MPSSSTKSKILWTRSRCSYHWRRGVVCLLRPAVGVGGVVASTLRVRHLLSAATTLSAYPNTARHHCRRGRAEYERFADSMVTRSVERNMHIEDAAQSVGEFCPGGIDDQRDGTSRYSRRRWRSAQALPRVEPDVVMVVTGGQKGRLRAIAFSEFKSKHSAVECQCPVQICHL